MPGASSSTKAGRPGGRRPSCLTASTTMRFDCERWDWFEAQQAKWPRDSILNALGVLIGADLTPRLGKIECPTLLLHPDGSPFIPVPVVAELHRLLPNARTECDRPRSARLALFACAAVRCAAADFSRRARGRLIGTRVVGQLSGETMRRVLAGAVAAAIALVCCPGHRAGQAHRVVGEGLLQVRGRGALRRDQEVRGRRPA